MSPYKISIFLITSTISYAQSSNENSPIYDLRPLEVQSSPLAQEISDLTQYWSVSEGKTLLKEKSTTLGATLALQPGIAQSFYGPNASRPIIRGLEGNRIRIVQNGMENFDVSDLSSDHAVATNLLLIDRIEILRGSSALLFGSNAIGGVVNVTDKSIPRQLPENGFSGNSMASYNSGDSGKRIGALITVGEANMGFQANASIWQSDDYRVPLYERPDGTMTKIIDNSQSENYSFGFGGALYQENGYIGMSFSSLDMEYGVPNEESPTIQLDQKRVDIRGSWEPRFIEAVNEVEIYLGYGDYRHYEIEESGETAATFLKEGVELRLTAVHSHGIFEGAFGLQGSFMETEISGEENPFSGASGRNPAIENESAKRIAVFLVEEVSLSESWSANAGIRGEGYFRDFTGAQNRNDWAFSSSLGVLYKFDGNWSLSGNLNYTERVPEAAELFSDGPHPATGGFQVGNPLLNSEKALAVELVLRRTVGSLTTAISAYSTDFDDYIFLAETGRRVDAEGNFPAAAGEEELMERQYRGVDARFYGFEAETTWRAVQNSDWTLDFNLFSDAVFAENITDGNDLPSIPPIRIGVGFNLMVESFSIGVDAVHVSRQSKVGPGESESPSHTLLSLFSVYQWTRGTSVFELYFKGENLTDELALVHTSFLRDWAPLPGIHFETGLRMKF